MALIKLNNRGVRNVSTFGSVAPGSMTFIKKLTASSSGTLSFVDGSSDVVLDDTYKEYMFTFNNIHPGTDGKQLTINGSIDSGSNYNVTKTTAVFSAQHNEDDNDTSLPSGSDKDIAQGTGAAIISFNSGNDNDQCTGGYLHLFNPSSTTFVKHFTSVANTYHSANYSINTFVAGYFNTTSAVDAIQFAMDSGNIDAGDICLYGIK